MYASTEWWKILRAGKYQYNANQRSSFLPWNTSLGLEHPRNISILEVSLLSSRPLNKLYLDIIEHCIE